MIEPCNVSIIHSYNATVVRIVVKHLHQLLTVNILGSDVVMQHRACPSDIHTHSDDHNHTSVINYIIKPGIKHYVSYTM